MLESNWAAFMAISMISRTFLFFVMNVLFALAVVLYVVELSEVAVHLKGPLVQLVLQFHQFRDVPNAGDNEGNITFHRRRTGVSGHKNLLAAPELLLMVTGSFFSITSRMTERSMIPDLTWSLMFLPAPRPV
jgi:hypothetical protein